MSLDLIFWKQSAASTLSPSEILNHLRNGSSNDIAEELPREEIFKALKLAYPGLYQMEDVWQWDSAFRCCPTDYPQILEQYGEVPESLWEEDTGGFIVYLAPFHLEFCCNFLDNISANSIIDVMSEFGCPLYDPQIDHRFDKA